MWWLVSVQDEGVRYGLLVGKEYIVGRKDGDIVVPADQSMSRKHAILRVNYSEPDIGHLDHIPELQLTDTSKLGTMLQDDRFRADTRTVTPGCQILFGTGGESKFRAVYKPCVITTSCLEVSAKRNLRPCVTKLGAHLVADWRKQCTLLVMSSLSVTIKVICAMVSQRSIVTPQYLEDLKKAVKANAKLPNPNDYTPPLAESQVNPSEVSFEQNPTRKTLFQGKIFIFLSPKQFKKLSLAVELAGGTPMLMEEDSDGADDLLTAPHTCVMHTQPDPAAMSQNALQWAQRVITRLQEKGLRTIQDSELGYAVLYASTDRFCNPTVDPDVQDVRPPPTQSLSHMPLVEPSQRSRAIKLEKPSQQSSNNQGKQKKRARTDSSDEAQPAAKLARSNARGAGVADLIEVKPEPATPVRSSRKRSPTPTSPGPRRSQRRPSPAPNQDTSPSPRSRARKESSPAPSSSSSRSRRAAKSPSPSPSKRTPSPSKRTTSRKSPEKEKSKRRVVDEFDDFDFDSIPTRRNKGRGKGKATEKLEPMEDLFEPDSEMGAHDFDSVPSRRKKRGRDEDELTEQNAKRRRDEVAEEVDEFDDVPTRRNNRKGKKVGGANTEDVDLFDDVPSRKSHQAKNKSEKPDEIDPFDDIPTRKSRKESKKDERTKTEEIDPFDDIPTRRNREESKKEERTKAKERKEESGFDDSDDDVDLVLSQVEIPDEFDDVPSRRKGKKGKQETKQDVPEKKAVEEVKVDSNKNNVKASTITVSTQPPPREASQDPTDNTGFLSTSRPMADQVVADPSSLVDKDAEGGTEVVEVSLIARQPGQREKKKSAAESNMWKGKTVKNFKCFKKVGKAALSLPRIIGGSDLIVHESKPQELDAWLREATQAEREYTQADREADAMFDWDGPRRKGRK